MFINIPISKSGCLSLHTKCHRAFDESLRSGCVASNKKSAKTCFQTGIVLPLIEIRKKRGKLCSWAGNSIISLVHHLMNFPGLGVWSFFSSRQRDRGKPCRGCLGGGPYPHAQRSPLEKSGILLLAEGALGGAKLGQNWEWEVNLFENPFALERGGIVLLKKAIWCHSPFPFPSPAWPQ